MRKLLALLLIVSSPAIAADKCVSLKAMQRDLRAVDKDMTAASMTPAQFHFLQGLYVGNPKTPEGMPPGDGAMIFTESSEDNAVIVWTRGEADSRLACGAWPIKGAGDLAKILAKVKRGETSADDPT